MTLSCSSTDFGENDSATLRPSRGCAASDSVMPLTRRVYRLPITQLLPSGGIHTAASHPSSISTSKGSRLIRRPSVAIVLTEYVRNNRLPEPVIRVKQPALARFSPDVSPLFVHFRADDDVTARLYARGYRLRPEFFKWRKIVLRPTPTRGLLPGIQRHSWPHCNDFQCVLGCAV